jgi:hypothetical protein
LDEQTRLDQLNEDIRAAVDVVDVALESDEEARQISAGKLVEELALRYREILSALPDKEREEAERGIGRRLTDLRRAAAALSRRDSGRAIPLARDAGMLPFIEQRQPPKSIVPQRAAPSGGKLSVGSELDSWCGKCKEMTTHNIVAMVGDQAKQVICQVCSSRHEHRTEPPARHRNAARPGVVSDGGGGGAAGANRRGNEDRELAKRQEAKRLLQKELNEAVDPRPFDPKGRYKAGEIIAHPEYGRGKIENVLRGSLLVRFLEGLRPLNLQ